MIIVQQRYHRSDIVNNRWLTYVYGDNDTRTGFGGQAHACRGEPNTIGVRTKKRPDSKESSYYTDLEYEENIRKIGGDIDAIQLLLEQGNVVVFPTDGIGTGRACLRTKAPQTYIYLNNRLHALQEKYRPIEDSRELIVSIYNNNDFKLVPLKPNHKTVEAAKRQLLHRLRALGVEVAYEPALKELARVLYRTMNEVEILPDEGRLNNRRDI